MIESELDEHDPLIERIAEAARRPAAINPAAKARLMAAIRAEPAYAPGTRHTVWRWMVDRRVSLSPLGSLAMAAGLVGIGVIAGVVKKSGSSSAPTSRDGLSTGQPSVVATANDGRRLPVTDTVVMTKFVIVAPRAAKVTVVGDFNEWQANATPMQRVPGSDQWSVTLPLDAGRHVYSFMVDGQWATDPAAPQAPDDGFGHANSVVMVSRGSAL